MAVKPSLEKSVEAELVARVTALGGIAEKVTVLGRRGFFDRLVVLPGGITLFVECKRPRGGKMSVQQIVRHETYAKLGARLAIVCNSADIDRLLKRWAAALERRGPD